MKQLSYTVKLSNLNRIADTGFFDIQSAQLYKDLYSHLKIKIRNRYLLNSIYTPYAAASIGTKQRISGLTRGIDAKFGIDSGDLLHDISNNVKISKIDGIMIYSDLVYAKYIDTLFTEKGKYSPDSNIFIDDDDLQFIEDLVIEADHF